MNWAKHAALAAGAVVLLAAQPALADRNRDWKLCNGGADISPDLQVAGCTARIQSGLEVPVLLTLAYAYRAGAYAQLSEFTRAIEDYDWVLNRKPNDAGTLIHRGNAYLELRQYARSIEDYDRALKLKPDRYDAFANRGTAYLGLGQYARAIEDFDRAITLAPNDALSYNARCWGRALQGQQLDAALADCTKALELTPKDAAILNSQAFVYFRLGDWPAAIKEYDAALAVNPREASSFYVRGLAKLKLGDGVGGSADIAAAKALNSNIAERYAGYGVKP